MRAETSAAGWVKSIQAISRESFGARVARAGSWGVRCGGAGGELVEDLGEEGCAEEGEAVVEFAGGFGGADGGGGGSEDVAGVHDAGDFYHADAGDGVVIENGPVDGGGAAVFREE